MVGRLSEKELFRFTEEIDTVVLALPVGLCIAAGKESACNVGDLGSIPGLGRSPGEGNSYPLQDSGLENSTDCIVHRVTKSRTQLRNFHIFIYTMSSLFIHLLMDI